MAWSSACEISICQTYEQLKLVFAKLGVPQQIVIDNEP